MQHFWHNGQHGSLELYEGVRLLVEHIIICTDVTALSGGLGATPDSCIYSGAQQQCAYLDPTVHWRRDN